MTKRMLSIIGCLLLLSTSAFAQISVNEKGFLLEEASIDENNFDSLTVLIIHTGEGMDVITAGYKKENFLLASYYVPMGNGKIIGKKECQFDFGDSIRLNIENRLSDYFKSEEHRFEDDPSIENCRHSFYLSARSEMYQYRVCDPENELFGFLSEFLIVCHFGD